MCAEVDQLKQQLDSLRPLPPAALSRVEEAFSVAYTYESNRIEGNTLTLQETDLVVREGLTIAGKSMREHLEAINHFEAVSFIRDVARQQEPLTLSTLLSLHALVLRAIDTLNAGKWRDCQVVISGSTHTPPPAFRLQELMERFFVAFREKEDAGEHPLLIAAYLHEELVRIHPFIDGNGRTARLLSNLYLLRHGYIIVNIKGSPESRMAYYQSLERSHQTEHREAFARFFVNAEREALQEHIRLVTGDY